VRRRLLGLCLLAYPRATRERDREHLRDLALDLADTQGLSPQALSLLRGGFVERVARGRSRRGGDSPTWRRRAIIGGIALAAIAATVSGLGAAGGAARVEVERLSCAYADDPGTKRSRAAVAPSGACADAESTMIARQRQGWDCAARRALDGRGFVLTWRCSLTHELPGWRPL